MSNRSRLGQGSPEKRREAGGGNEGEHDQEKVLVDEPCEELGCGLFDPNRSEAVGVVACEDDAAWLAMDQARDGKTSGAMCGVDVVLDHDLGGGKRRVDHRAGCH